MKTAFVQSAFYAGYFIVAIPASLFIKKTSYKIGIMTGLAFFALGCFIFFVDRISASYLLSKVRETRVLTVYMIIGCVILLGTAFILPRHRAVGRRPVLPDCIQARHVHPAPAQGHGREERGLIPPPLFVIRVTSRID